MRGDIVDAECVCGMGSYRAAAVRRQSLYLKKTIKGYAETKRATVVAPELGRLFNSFREAYD